MALLLLVILVCHFGKRVKSQECYDPVSDCTSTNCPGCGSDPDQRCNICCVGSNGLHYLTECRYNNGWWWSNPGQLCVRGCIGEYDGQSGVWSAQCYPYEDECAVGSLCQHYYLGLKTCCTNHRYKMVTCDSECIVQTNPDSCDYGCKPQGQTSGLDATCYEECELNSALPIGGYVCNSTTERVCCQGNSYECVSNDPGNPANPDWMQEQDEVCSYGCEELSGECYLQDDIGSDCPASPPYCSSVNPDDLVDCSDGKVSNVEACEYGCKGGVCLSKCETDAKCSEDFCCDDDAIAVCDTGGTNKVTAVDSCYYGCNDDVSLCYEECEMGGKCAREGKDSQCCTPSSDGEPSMSAVECTEGRVSSIPYDCTYSCDKWNGDLEETEATSDCFGGTDIGALCLIPEVFSPCFDLYTQITCSLADGDNRVIGTNECMYCGDPENPGETSSSCFIGCVPGYPCENDVCAECGGVEKLLVCDPETKIWNDPVECEGECTKEGDSIVSEGSCKVKSGTSSSKANVGGIIAGSVIGGVGGVIVLLLVLAAVIGIVVCVCIRKKGGRGENIEMETTEKV